MSRKIHTPIALAAALCLAPARADDFFIADTDVDALIDAVNAANANGEPDTIHLAPGGHYTLTRIVAFMEDGNGLPLITSDITVEGNEAIIQRSDAKGTLPFRVFFVTSSGHLTLNDLTITNADTTNGGAAVYIQGVASLSGCLITANHSVGAGAVRVQSGASLVMTQCALTNNESGDGGALSSNRGAVAVIGCLLSGNSASDDGGAIQNGGFGAVLELVDCVISDNSSASMGGAIYNVNNDPTLIATGCDIIGNQAGAAGGAIYNDSEYLTLTRCDISHNTADSVGGGLRNDGGGTYTITECTFADNTGSNGGGIHQNDGYMDLVACTISGNIAQVDGGGVNNDANLTMTNCTVSGNSAGADGGGIRGDCCNDLAITNCTITHNSAGSEGAGIYVQLGFFLSNSIVANSVGAADITGIYTDVGYNIVESGFGLTQKTSMPGDPALADLADNAGPTLTHALLPESIAIDAGDCADGAIVLDQRGVKRPQGKACDIGAFEREPCSADVNGDGRLNILDFVAYQDLFQSGNDAADCDGNGALNVLDFVCYQSVFQAGC